MVKKTGKRWFSFERRSDSWAGKILISVTCFSEAAAFAVGYLTSSRDST